MNILTLLVALCLLTSCESLILPLVTAPVLMYDAAQTSVYHHQQRSLNSK